MVPKRIVAFLLSVAPLFLALLWLWQTRGYDRFYYRAIAALTDLVYPPLSARHAVQAVGSNRHEFVLHLLVDGRHTTLFINAQDICWNVAMTLALYLASASRQLRFWKWLGGSIAALLVVHSITVMTMAQEGLLANPDASIAGLHTMKPPWWLVHYNRFYEELGVQLLVLALWLPYGAVVLRGRANARGREQIAQKVA